MRTLWVLYDARCAVCERCRRWMEGSEAHVSLRFLDCRSPATQERFREIPFLVRELVVVDERGRWWAGPAAFILCLWALTATRGLAELLSEPLLAPLVGLVFRLISSQRGLLGPAFGVPACDEGHCAAPAHAGSPYR